MADEEKRPEAASDDGQNEDDLAARFPTLPPPPDLPNAPTLAPKLPPHPAKPRPDKVEPGSYKKMGLAYTAASSFIAPILIFSLGGYWLDKRLHHTTYWLAFVGVLVGMVVGISSLIRVSNQLSDDPPQRR